MANPYEPFLQYDKSVEEMTTSYNTLVTRQSPTPLYLSLPDKEQSQARAIAEKSVVRNYADAINFGMNVQEDVKAFANQLFSKMKKADSEKINRILHQLVNQLNQIEPERLQPKQSNFIKRLFSRNYASSIQQTVSQYKRLSKQVDRLAIELKHAQQDLLKDIDQIHFIYEQNKTHFMQLNVYIAAIELKLHDLQACTVPQQPLSLVDNDDIFSIESNHDVEQAIEWLDKRKYDLEISREITLQAVPQLKMMQQTNELLIEKISSSVLATIPMWQTQIATILTMGHQTKLQSTQARIDRMNEQMHETNIQSVKQVFNEVSIDELKTTQRSLVDCILDTIEAKKSASQVSNRS